MVLRRHVVLGVAVAAALPAKAQPVKITLGTATPGGGFPVYGAAFVDGVRRIDPSLEIEAVNTKVSTENVPRLEAGTLDIALVQGEVVHESQNDAGDVGGRRCRIGLVAPRRDSVSRGRRSSRRAR